MSVQSFTVYQVILDNKVKYIGITSKSLKQRIKDHFYEANIRNSKFLIHKAIRKYGTFIKFEEIETVNSKEEAIFLEKYYIKHYQTFVKENGYNLTLGGEGNFGAIRSEQTRRRISLSKTGKTPNRLDYSHNQKTKDLLRLKNLGKSRPYKWVKIIDNNGVIYNSITEAAKINNLKRTTINEALRMNRTIKSINKKFNYYEEI